MIGEQIGNFRIVAQLGAGGMGEVFLAEHEKIGTKVAIKMLQPHISANTEHVERFFNEAIAASKIQHAGIGKIFDVGHTDAGRAYLVMEFLDGETLAARIKRLGRLPLAQVSDIGRQIASVLEAVHRASITHRDLKPDNVFLVPDSELASGERVKILDFGIAKLSGHSAGLTATAAGSMGTPAYMSPEQWKNTKNVDWRADAYSLGCLAFEMVAGRPPFVAETIGEACAKHLTEEPPRIGSLVAVPPQLDHLIARLLAKDPSQRPSSMREIGNQFGVLADAGVATTMPAMPAYAPSAAIPVMAPTVTTLGGAASSMAGPPPARRRRGLVIALAVAGAAIAVGGTVLAISLASSSAKPDEPTAAKRISDPPPKPGASLADATAVLATLVHELDGLDDKIRAQVSVLVAATTDADRAAARTKLAALRTERAALVDRVGHARDKVVALGGTPPQPSSEPPTDVGPPALAADEVEAVVRKHTAAIGACYARADASAGKAVVTATVTPEGQVSAVELSGGAETHTYGQCLAKLVRGWAFRASPGGTFRFSLARPEQVAQTPPPPKPVEPVEKPSGCDEVSCVLNNYEGACCAKFKKKQPCRRACPMTDRDERGCCVAKPGALPATIDRAMIQAGIGRIRGRALACGDKTGVRGVVKLTIRVNPEGDVTSVDVKAGDPTLGDCVALAVRDAHFAKTESGGSFTYPFAF